MDDDDEFLYGPSTTAAPASSHEVPIAPASAAPSNNVVAKLEAEADAQMDDTPGLDATPGLEATPGLDAPSETGGDEDDEMEDSEDEDDIEIIMEPTASRSLDLRHNRGRSANNVNATANRSTPTGQQPSLTTEYQPIQRGAPTPSTQAPAPQPLPQTSTPAPSATPAAAQQQKPKTEPEPEDDGVDPNTLPPAPRAESQPEIDPSAPGMFEGRPIIEVDLAALVDKPWRRPGADISDWFNYGFDEISWEAYCYRRRDLGEMADVLKANVLNFSGMPEDQLTQLPPEVRQMVMTGTNALMNNAAAGGMMPNAGMMMDMGGMMDMGMGGMGGGGMGGGGMGGMGGMQMDQQQQQGGTPKQEFEGMDGGMGYGMGMPMGEYGMQEQQQMQQQMGAQMNPQMAAQMGGPMNPQMQQQMGGQMGFQGMEGPSQSPPVPTGPGRGAPPPFRGRGQPRGRGFAARGRGRGIFTDTPAPPVRSTSPLPPNVPTGPRNQNKYKDRDNNAQSVDGLDYGGGAAARTQSREPDERSSSAYRKRRASPTYDERSSSKRR